MQTVSPAMRQINHKVMRVIVGITAILLSPVVWLLSDTEIGLSSISISYWTDSHDIFVGALIAVGFFLSAYNGAGGKKDREYILSKFACVCAIVVALFPTEGFPDSDMPAKWVIAIADSIGSIPQYIHYTAAILLFACLIALMWFFSIRAKAKGKPGRALFYRITSILMGTGILVIYIIGYIFELPDTTFWIEFWGLSLFGLGWLVAGSYKSD